MSLEVFLTLLFFEQGHRVFYLLSCPLPAHQQRVFSIHHDHVLHPQ